ncbi:endonuclease domain-containing protein [Luteimonas terrae]|uniref:endonuclease domain-containing protein n=1 Tax=Luteimonas terrae TaxID=1530191 RepID=UPI001AA074C2
MRDGQRTLLAKRLRRAMTPAEQVLRRHLRARQRCNLKFRRQHPIGPFIVDFVSLEPALVIEVGGGQHNGSQSDAARDHYLRRRGFEVLRFWNTRCYRIRTPSAGSWMHGSREGMYAWIESCVRGPFAPTQPSPARGGGLQTPGLKAQA